MTKQHFCNSIFFRPFSLCIVGVGVSILSSLSWGAPLANPAVAFPEARAAVGVSYSLSAYTITNDSIPSLMNRFHLRASYAPVSFVNFGLDGGLTNIEVSSVITGTDTLPPFEGNYGFSGGGHFKLSSPFFFNDFLAFIGIAQATYFSSKNRWTARYGGIEGCGAVGIQIHIAKFGYLSLGGAVDLIQGKNRSFRGEEGYYSNLNNFRGWIAVDFFPPLPLSGNTHPYLSLEITVSPYTEFGGDLPVREFGFSVCIGSVTKRLYGEETQIPWQP